MDYEKAQLRTDLDTLTMRLNHAVNAIAELAARLAPFEAKAAAEAKAVAEAAEEARAAAAAKAARRPFGLKKVGE